MYVIKIYVHDSVLICWLSLSLIAVYISGTVIVYMLSPTTHMIKMIIWHRVLYKNYIMVVFKSNISHLGFSKFLKIVIYLKSYFQILIELYSALCVYMLENLQRKQIS